MSFAAVTIATVLHLSLTGTSPLRALCLVGQGEEIETKSLASYADIGKEALKGSGTEWQEAPAEERKLRSQDLGEVVVWRGVLGGAKGADSDEYFVTAKNDDAISYVQLPTTDSMAPHDGAIIYRYALKRVAELKRGKGRYLWVELVESFNEDLSEDQSGPYSKKHSERLLGHVLAVGEDGGIRLLTCGIPITDDSVKENGKPAQIDVDVNEKGQLVVKARSSKVSKLQRRWIGSHALPKVGGGSRSRREGSDGDDDP
jgi:hypothetical protein